MPSSRLPLQVGIIPYAGFEIAFFEGIKQYWERKQGKQLHPVNVMATGAIAGAGAQILTYPVALVRTRMQAQAAMTPPVSMRQTIVTIARADGLRGFYRVCRPSNLAFQLHSRFSLAASRQHFLRRGQCGGKLCAERICFPPSSQHSPVSAMRALHDANAAGATVMRYFESRRCASNLTRHE
jgi:hypothetical protein